MPNEPAPAASTWWKCKCPEYNNHRGIFSCSKCGASSSDEPVPTNDTPPKALCQNCKNGCYFVNDEPCRCACHAAKAQTVPELVVDLQEYFSVWHRERTQWHSNITDLAIQQHYAEIGRKLDTRFPAIADYLLSQEAELTRLRSGLQKIVDLKEHSVSGGEVRSYGIALHALYPQGRATP